MRARPLLRVFKVSNTLRWKTTTKLSNGEMRLTFSGTVAILKLSIRVLKVNRAANPPAGEFRQNLWLQSVINRKKVQAPEQKEAHKTSKVKNIS